MPEAIHHKVLMIAYAILLRFHRRKKVKILAVVANIKEVTSVRKKILDKLLPSVTILPSAQE